MRISNGLRATYWSTGPARRDAEPFPVFECERGGAAEPEAVSDLAHAVGAQDQGAMRMVESQVARMRHGGDAPEIDECLLQRAPAHAAVASQIPDGHGLA